MFKRFSAQKTSPAFTVTELMIVLMIIAMLFGLTSLSLVRPQVKASVDGELLRLMSEIRSQQLEAMSGDGATSVTAYGVYFETTKYTLFQGTTYVAGNANNFVINLESNVQFTNITLPSNALVFLRRSGEVNNYSGGIGFRIQNTDGSNPKDVTFNLYGVPTLP